MAGHRYNHEDLELIPLSVGDALRSLPDLPPMIVFPENGTECEHERTLVSLPAGDELYTGKQAVVWSEPLTPTSMPIGSLGIVESINKEDGEE